MSVEYADTPATTFDAVSALEEVGPGRFSADLSPEWTIGGKPNGGYLLAILGRAASAASSHRDVVAASAHYVRGPDPGEVAVEAELLRDGRSAGQVHARLLQDDRVCVDALLTTSELDPSSVAHWEGGVPEPGRVPYNDCVRLEPRAPDGLAVRIMDQVDLRLEPDSASFAQGVQRGRGELRGWLALPGGAPFDPFSLIFAVDAFPPATFDIEYAGWVPTLELTVYVRAVPAPGPVRVLQRARLIAGQRVDAACFVWDTSGSLVAQGTQLAGIRLG